VKEQMMTVPESPQPDFTTFPPASRIVDGLSKLAKVIRQQAWSEAWGKGLTPTQGQILLSLSCHPEKRRTLPELSSDLGVSKVTACLTIQVLARKRLVRKERRRRVLDKLYVKLTPKGEEAATEASRWTELLASIIQTLPSAQQVDLHRALVRLITTLQERKEIAVSQMCVTCNYFRANVHDDPAAPHHCEFIGKPFGDGQIRLNCPDHQKAPNLIQLERWRTAQHA
jgi:DNA-binding MarR family transcriptional regulator